MNQTKPGVAPDKYTFLIVDDPPAFLELARSVLEAYSGFQVVGEATSCKEALMLIPHLRPRVVISDIMMPEEDGLELTRRIKSRFPEVVVILASTQYDAIVETLAANAGALALVPKSRFNVRVIRRLLNT